MSFKRKVISAVTTAFAVFTFAAFVSAQDTSTNNQQNPTQKQDKFERRGGFGKHGDGKFGGGKGMRGGRGGGFMREFGQLNLTDAQKQQIHTILEGNRPDKANFQEMGEIMKAKRDGTLTDAQKQRLEAFHQQMKQNQDQVQQQILAVLTPEQRTQLDQIRAERKQKFEQRRQEWQNRKNQQTPTTENKDN